MMMGFDERFRIMPGAVTSSGMYVHPLARGPLSSTSSSSGMRGLPGAPSTTSYFNPAENVRSGNSNLSKTATSRDISRDNSNHKPPTSTDMKSPRRDAQIPAGSGPAPQEVSGSTSSVIRIYPIAPFKPEPPSQSVVDSSNSPSLGSVVNQETINDSKRDVTNSSIVTEEEEKDRNSLMLGSEKNISDGINIINNKNDNDNNNPPISTSITSEKRDISQVTNQNNNNNTNSISNNNNNNENNDDTYDDHISNNSNQNDKCDNDNNNNDNDNVLSNKKKKSRIE